ncbi:MAG: cell division protein FtsK [Bacilli bacterium]|nr:cell division protein FtsK [Bacilli bacterium]
MSKRKKSKISKSYFCVIYGIILILMGILGICCYGPVGKIFCALSAFFFGELYLVPLGLIVLIGIYVIFSQKFPDFWSPRALGITILLMGLVMLLHKDNAVQVNTAKELFKTACDKAIEVFKIVEGTSKEAAFQGLGGGFIGGLLMLLFMSLFDFEGSRIIYWVFIVVGSLLFTGISIVDIIKNFYNRSKELVPKPTKEEKKRIEKEEIIKEQDKLLPEGEVLINDNSKSKVDDNKRVIDRPQAKKEEAETPPISDTDKFIDHTNKNYQLPTIDILDKPKKQNADNQSGIETNIKKLEEVLQEFDIIGKVVAVTVGPACTQYEMALKPGTKLSRLTSLNKEISLALAKKDVRIEAPIPGKNTVGIEMANDTPTTVYIKEIMESIPNDEKTNSKKLLVALGKDIKGETKFCEINKTPHLLVAGSTGSGKSVCINCILASILMRTKPDEVKLILVDPKKVELSMYNGVPHLLRPVVTDPKKASVALQLVVQEMEHRYDVFEQNGVKNIDTYNEKVEKDNKKRDEDDQVKKMPYIVVIVDELADLMMVAGKEVEASIMRITQMARAAGIHLIIATQRPSTDVITGVVKANIPSRIAFAVASQIDSRTILDMMGAEKLLGRGDMLYLPQGENSPTRIQGAWICEEEIHRIIDYVCNQQKAQYDARFENLDVEKTTTGVGGETGIDANHDAPEEYDDPLYNEIVDFVIEQGKASASLLQRRFKLGYNRAARVIDLLEERGIIGPATGNSKPREVLVKYGNDDEELL